MSGLKEMVEKKQQLIAEAEDKCADVAERLREAKQKLEHLSQEKDELDRKIRLRVTELERKQRNLKEITQKYDSAIERKQSSDIAANDYKETTEKVEVLEDEHRTLTSELRQVEQDLADLERRHRKLQTDVSIQRKRYDNYCNKSREVSMLVDKDMEQVSSLSTGKDFDEDSAIERQQELDSKIRESSVTNEEWERKVRTFNRKKTDLQNELLTLRNSADKIKQEMAAMESELLA